MLALLLAALSDWTSDTADYGAVAIRDANRLASGATGGCATKVTAMAGGEAKVLL